MRSNLLIAFLLLFSISAPAQRLTVRRIAAGDLDGDGRDEVVTWDSESKELVVTSPAVGRKLAARSLDVFPTFMIVTGPGELLIGEGLRGYNPKEGPQTDAVLRLYRPLDGWKNEEIYRQATERPQFTELRFVDLDGDGKPEILFAYFANKYFVDFRVARRSAGAWVIEKLPQIRMGTGVAAADVLGEGRVRLIVGRPYGEDIGKLGDAFFLDGERRTALPVHRGVSSIAAARGYIVVGDGWHQDYGKIARARLALIQPGIGSRGWDYELIEDLPEHVRITRLELADLDGDGRAEIIAHGERRASLGGDVRVYQRTPAGWRGLTAARDVQGFAFGRFTGDGSRSPLQLAFTESQHFFALEPSTATWDAKLGAEVHTYAVDPKGLLERMAPALSVKTWSGPGAMPAPDLPALHGRVVMLDFWATWCKPCIAQFTKMREWHERYGPRGLVILGITDYSSQTHNDILAFLDKHKLPWTVGIDPDKRTQMDYGVSPIPHTFLIDRSGRVRLSHVGGADLGMIEKQIESLLGERE